MTQPITALLFDKDGTLFHFGETWNGWAAMMIDRFSGGNAIKRAALAEVTGYDLDSGQFDPHSPVIAGTNKETAECLLPVLTEYNLSEIEALLNASAVDVPLSPTIPLAPFFSEMKTKGYAIGLMTNDTEEAARAHLNVAGIHDMFDFIAGFDSGFGAKPSPAPLLAFADAMGHAPETILMVGDSTHDLQAGRAAGMRTAGVLTGPARRDVLSPFADVVLPDIGHLPLWLSGGSPKND
ncbi:HAD family hydrolase [Primorskyibacter sp. 2E233]|uniref:HAD family hydrolase n=1 Tax=Primorskyibacter sp. 2E233 TaxID=3413431 RepID=UPI003BF08C13